MTDNITLRRAVGELVQDLIDHAYNDGVEKFQYRSEQTIQAKKALLDRFAALAEPEKVPHTHEWFRTGAMEPGVMRCISCGEWGKSALAEPPAPPQPPAKPEPATVEQIDEEYIGPVIDARWHDFEAGFRAAERFHGITKGGKT
jgi:hypothetical protein